MLLRFTTFSLLILLLVACLQSDPLPGNAPWKKIDTILEKAHAEDRFHGCVAIGNQDSLLYQKSLGIADRNWNIPMDAKVRFDIASLNKSFVAALILLAVEEGKLGLKDTLTNLFSRYPGATRFDPRITLHHLLTHTSGLADYDGIPGELAAHGFARFKRIHFTSEAYVGFISALAPVAAPGERFHYSNFAYHLLSILLEDVYRAPFGEILREKITRPLGMDQTFSTTSNEAVFPRVAEAYTYLEREDHWVRNNFIDLSLGRRIFSTASDLFLWGQAMSDNRLLNAASRELMRKNHLAGICSDFSYGYGWVVYGEQEAYRMGDLEIDQVYLIHGGATEGYRSMLVIINEGEHILTFLSNVGNRTNEMELAKALVHSLLNNT